MDHAHYRRIPEDASDSLNRCEVPGRRRFTSHYATLQDTGTYFLCPAYLDREGLAQVVPEVGYSIRAT